MNSKLAIELKHNGEPVLFVNCIEIQRVIRVSNRSSITNDPIAFIISTNEYKIRIDLCGNCTYHSTSGLINLGTIGDINPQTYITAFRLDDLDGRQFLIGVPSSQRPILRAQAIVNSHNVIEKDIVHLKSIWLFLVLELPLTDAKFLFKDIIIGLHKKFLDHLERVCNDY
jgi:hypothetical protein